MQFSLCLTYDVNHTGEGLCGILNFRICMVHAREILSLRRCHCVDIHIYHRGVDDEFSCSVHLKRPMRLAFE